MLISVHVPKCAGSSFQHLLERHFGARLRLDYDDRPLAEAYRWRRLKQRWSGAAQNAEAAQVDCVHGHFLARKYDFLGPSARRITWLRDPLQRVVSHYRYWQRMPDLRNGDCRRLIEKHLSLAQFAALPKMRNVMTRFLDGKRAHEFYFIGLVEDMRGSLARFTRLTGIPGDASNPENGDRDATRQECDSLPAALRSRIEQLNRHDCLLHDEVVKQLERS